MIFRYICIVLTIFCAFSCTLKKQEFEHLEFTYSRYSISRTDKSVIVRFFPSLTSSQENVKVELIYHGKSFMRRSISKEKYNKIVNVILKIQDDEIDNKTNSVQVYTFDAGHNSIEYRKGNFIQKHLSIGMSKEYNYDFYHAAELIFSAAGLDVSGLK